MASHPCYPEKAATINTLFDTLAHNVRREVIYYFEQCTEAETATIDELVEHIEPRIPGRSAEHVEIELVHKHVPKLADREWVEYDRRTRQIRYLGHDRARQFIREVHDVF